MKLILPQTLLRVGNKIFYPHNFLCWTAAEMLMEQKSWLMYLLLKECLPKTHQKSVISFSSDDAQKFLVWRLAKTAWMYFLQLFCLSKQANETKLYLCLSSSRPTGELLSSPRKHRAISCFTCFLPEARTTIHFSIRAGPFPSPCAPQSAQTPILGVKPGGLQGRETRHSDLENFFLMGFPSENQLLCHSI